MVSSFIALESEGKRKVFEGSKASRRTFACAPPGSTALLCRLAAMGCADVGHVLGRRLHAVDGPLLRGGGLRFAVHRAAAPVRAVGGASTQSLTLNPS